MSEHDPKGPRDQGEIDREYADRFWQKQPEGMRAAYQSTIESAAKAGVLSIFVNPSGIDEKDKEKLSALRSLAKELGYEVGKFVLDKKAHTASAPIRKTVK